MGYNHLKLPDTLGELLDVALYDAKAAEAAGHELDMCIWLTVIEPKECICAVCLAGAVMLRRSSKDLRSSIFNHTAVEDPEDMEYGPTLFDERTADKLRAIDFIRSLNLNHAWIRLHHGDDLTINAARTLQRIRDDLLEQFDMDADHWPDTTVSGWWERMYALRNKLVEAGI